ncbi:V4R domain-containing protein [Planctomycetota bacterium]
MIQASDTYQPMAVNPLGEKSQATRAVSDNRLYLRTLTKLEFGAFVAQLQQVLKDLKIGILRIEKADLEELAFTLTVAEDLDCSGLPITDETVCHYDEGFIAGIFQAYTGKPFIAKEVDCWASGDRVCRFEASLRTEEDAWDKIPAKSCAT